MKRFLYGLAALGLMLAGGWLILSAYWGVGERRRVAAGDALYARHCASCHGAKLEGAAGDWRIPLADGSLPAPPHDESGHTWHHDDDLLFRYIKFGGAAVAPKGFKSNMPGFGATLSDDRIRAVLDFIKSRWPEEIRARQRQLTESRN